MWHKIRRVYYNTGKVWMRRLKWRMIELLNTHPSSRILYPLMEIVIWQQVWTATDKTGVIKWYIVHEPSDAARYYRSFSDNDGEDLALVGVQRPHGGINLRFVVSYTGHYEYTAVLYDEFFKKEEE